jgi:GNAT superfamily N-acetyltransferase
MSRAVLRAPRTTDANEIVACFREAFGADRQVDATEILSWLRSSEFAPEWLKVLELEGRVVGYADVVHGPDNDELEMCIAARGRWSTFLDWAESLAQDTGIGGTRAYVPAGHELEGIVKARDYTYWTSSLTMELDLDGFEHSDPTLPNGFTLATFRPGDEEPLRAALNDTFADDPFFQELTPQAFGERLLEAAAFDATHWHLAWFGDELAGFSLAFPTRPGEETLAHVNSLGVGERWRRRGLGETLLRTTFASLKDRGARRVQLGVVADNPTGAVRLYERVGMRRVGRWDNWVLRF